VLIKVFLLTSFVILSTDTIAIMASDNKIKDHGCRVDLTRLLTGRGAYSVIILEYPPNSAIHTAELVATGGAQKPTWVGIDKYGEPISVTEDVLQKWYDEGVSSNQKRYRELSISQQGWVADHYLGIAHPEMPSTK
jgi:hypothetical protein